MTQPNAIDAAIAAADAQSKTAAPGQDIQMVGQPGAGGVTTYSAPAPLSIQDITSGSMNVDGYLKVKEFGLIIDDKTGSLIKTVKAMIDFGKGGLTVFEGIRYGSPPVYKKTFDRLNCSTGGTWTEAVRQAQQVQPDARTYIGADIQLTLLEDAKDVSGAVVSAAGTRLGHSTSVTNRLNLAEFLKDPNVAKAQAEGGAVEVEIGFEKKTNPKKQTWGVLTFKYLNVADEPAE